MRFLGRLTVGHALSLPRANPIERLRYGPVTHAQDNPPLDQVPYALTQAHVDGSLYVVHRRGVSEHEEIEVVRHLCYFGVPGARVWSDLTDAIAADNPDLSGPGARWHYVVRGDPRQTNFGHQRFELQCPVGVPPERGARPYGTYRVALRTYAKSPLMTVDNLLVRPGRP